MIARDVLGIHVLAMSFLAGSELVARVQMSWHKPVARRTVEIPIEGETLQAHLYGENRRGAILIVHGMTLRGIQDPRMENLGRAFASAGFAVYAPQFPEVAALRITEETSRKAAQAGEWIARQEKERIGLFSASFSAGISLVAACRDIPHFITSVCTVGTLGHADTTLEFLMGQEGIDDYGTLIVLWNFISMPPGVREALYIAASDNGLERSPADLPGFLEKLTPDDRSLFLRYRTDRPFRMKEWHAFAATEAYRALDRQISPLAYARTVPFRTVLIHGEDDNVIPASESKQLFDAMKAHGNDVRLLTTPLISHGHGSFGPGAVFHAVKLASAFGDFLQAAADPVRKPLPPL